MLVGPLPPAKLSDLGLRRYAAKILAPSPLSNPAATSVPLARASLARASLARGCRTKSAAKSSAGSPLPSVTSTAKSFWKLFAWSPRLLVAALLKRSPPGFTKFLDVPGRAGPSTEYRIQFAQAIDAFRADVDLLTSEPQPLAHVLALTDYPRWGPMIRLSTVIRFVRVCPVSDVAGYVSIIDHRVCQFCYDGCVRVPRRRSLLCCKVLLLRIIPWWPTVICSDAQLTPPCTMMRSLSACFMC